MHGFPLSPALQALLRSSRAHPPAQDLQTCPLPTPGTTRRAFLGSLAASPFALLFVAQARFAQNTPAEALATRPALDCEGLERWRRSPRLPITESQDATECRILAAIREGSPLRLRYRSESQPGTEETRILTPCELLQVEGFPARYISGYCHTQEAFRTFRLDRIRVLA